MSIDTMHGPDGEQAEFHAAVPDLQPRLQPVSEVITDQYMLETPREGGALERLHVLESQPGQQVDIPTLVAPGFTETLGMLHEFVPVLAEVGGRRVMTLDHPRTAPAAVEVAEGDWREQFAVNHLDRGERLLDVLEASDHTDRADVVAHSEGCIDAIVAAMRAVEAGPNEEGEYAIRNVVLMNPGGVVSPQEHSAGELAVRGALEAAHMALNAARHPRKLGQALHGAREAAGYVLRNPKLSLAEVKGIAATDITTSLEYLKQHGIGVAIVADVDDALFPMERMQHAVKSRQIDGFYSVKTGGHNAISQDPETMGTAVAKIQDALRVRHEHPEDYTLVA